MNLDLNKLLKEHNITGVAMIAMIDDQGRMSLQVSSHKCNNNEVMGILYQALAGYYDGLEQGGLAKVTFSPNPPANE